MPARTVTEAFATLETANRRSGQLMVRVLMADGSRLTGGVHGISNSSLELILSPGDRVIRAADVEAIEVAELRTVHKLAVAFVAILGGTGALVAYSLLPGVNVERTDWPEVFGVVAVAGALFWKLLMSRPRIRDRITTWNPIYVVPDLRES